MLWKTALSTWVAWTEMVVCRENQELGPAVREDLLLPLIRALV